MKTVSRPLLFAAAALTCALAAGPATAQECRYGRSSVTGEQVYVCRDARGVWRLAAEPTPRRGLERGVTAPPRIIREPSVYDQRQAAEQAARRRAVFDQQRALNVVGCSAGRPDGVWGSQSRAAARCFQRSVGARETGYLTDDESAWLFSLAARGGAVAEAPRDPESDEPDALDPAGEEQAGEDLAGDELARDELARERDQFPQRPAPGPEDCGVDGAPECDLSGLSDARASDDEISETWRSESERLAEAVEQATEPDEAEAEQPDVSVSGENKSNTRAAGRNAPVPETAIASAAPVPAPPAPTPPAPAVARAAPEPAPAPALAPTSPGVSAGASSGEPVASLIGLEPAELTKACADGMRVRQPDASPWTALFNRVCRAHAYAIDDEMLKLGYDARLAALGDPDAEAAMARRRAEGEAGAAGSD